MTKAVVVYSGGQDSTTCLYWARSLFSEVIALSFDYGQRHVTELEAAQAITSGLGIHHYVLPLPALSIIGGSALVDANATLEAFGGMPDHAMPEGLPTSFVPGRNALFLATAAALAVRLGAKDIVTGVCQTDYSGYPDCREEFIQALAQTLSLAMPSSAGPLRIHTPLMHLTKAETVRMAQGLEGCLDALAHSITCYHGLRQGCMNCPACALRARGFAEAGIADPALAA